MTLYFGKSQTVTLSFLILQANITCLSQIPMQTFCRLALKVLTCSKFFKQLANNILCTLYIQSTTIDSLQIGILKKHYHWPPVTELSWYNYHTFFSDASNYVDTQQIWLTWHTDLCRLYDVILERTNIHISILIINQV